MKLCALKPDFVKSIHKLFSKKCIKPVVIFYSEAIRPLFADPVTYKTCSSLVTWKEIVNFTLTHRNPKNFRKHAVESIVQKLEHSCLKRHA